MVHLPGNGAAVNKRGYRFGICIFLIVAVLTVYWPATGFDFVNFDDNLYVEKIGSIEKEFTLDNVLWAFTHTTDITNYWVPITWLSFLVDYNLHGLEAGGYHLTNVLLHLCNVLLLFSVLMGMTGAVWKSGLVAALFALHPLHVESVVWVTERKDVLSTLFWFMTLWGYNRYVKHPSPGRYLAALFFFALGLMSKPMLVTLPFVLLLLDYWPFGRLLNEKTGWSRVVWEKIPFLVLALVFAIAAFLTQRQAGALATLGEVSIPSRIGNALNSYVQYIVNAFWPAKLSVIYPHPGVLPAWQVACAFLFLAAVTISVLVYYRRRPYLLVGWLWYLGTLVPVIGLVVIGPHAMADRYAYVPLVGIYIALVWGMQALADKYGGLRKALPFIAVLAIASLVPVTRAQVGYWRDSISLFSHALEVSDNSYIAHNNLGLALIGQGRFQESVGHFRESIRIKNNDKAHNNLGLALVKLGRTAEAIGEFKEVLRINPDHAEAHYNLGLALVRLGQIDEAVDEFTEVLRISPDHAEAHNNLGSAFLDRGQADAAVTEFNEALRINPDNVTARYNLGLVFLSLGRTSGAVEEFTEVLRVRPGHARAHYGLGLALLNLGRLNRAAEELREALQINPDYLEAHNLLGEILGRLGQLKEAAAEFKEALRIKPDDVVARRNLQLALQRLEQKQ